MRRYPRRLGSTRITLPAAMLCLLLSQAIQTQAGAGVMCKGKPATKMGTPAGGNLYGTDGNDVLVGLGGNDTINSGDGKDLICAGAGDDTLFGEGARDELYGEAGNDYLYGDGYSSVGSDDLLDGGSNVLFQGDWAYFVKSTSVNLQGGTAMGQGLDTLKGIENVYGSSENDSIIADEGPNYLLGYDGDDVIWGRDGSDIIDGGAGDDENLGGAGLADWIVHFQAPGPVNLDLMEGESTSGTDTDLVNGFELVVGSPYNDKLFGDARTNYLAGQQGNDELNGRDGLDLGVFYEPVTASLQTGLSNANTGDAQNEGSDTLENLEGLWGSNDDQTSDVLVGDAGNNLIRDGLGDDDVDGAGGDDYFFYDGGGDTITGGAGVYDVVDFSYAPSGVHADLTAGSFGPGTSLSGIEALLGSRYDDVLRGDGGVNYLFGNSGKDRLYGMDGPDGLNGGEGWDKLFGNAGTDGCAFSEHSVGCESKVAPPLHPLIGLRDATARVERRYK